MLFTSHEFLLVFLPVVFVGYFWLAARWPLSWAKVWLVSASLFFYGWWDPRYLALILASVLVNFAVGSSLSNSAGRHSGDAAGRRPEGHAPRRLLVLGIAFNLGLLGYFKYAGFVVKNLNLLGLELTVPDIVLPLAISFFTFQQIAYLVDSFRGHAEEPDLLTYTLFVTFFPQLIAGPIVHHAEMMPQFADPSNKAKNYDHIALGLFVFGIGLAKKILIADTFAVWASMGFDVATSLSLVDAWVTSLSYTFQLYFDFSGYTDMAIGVALLFNIRLPFNFDSPYKARSVQDFWRRWHITLSRFLRDYVYIPLGGNRAGEARTFSSLFITFLLAGLWHGASWMFVLWGAMHGAALVVHRIWTSSGRHMHPAIAWFVTFNFVNLAWVFFRAEDMTAAMKVLRGMTGLSGLQTPVVEIPTTSLVWMGPLADRLALLMPWPLVVNALPLLLFVPAFFILSRQNFNPLVASDEPPRWSWFLMGAALASLAFVSTTFSPSEVFLYFDF